jgi:hypothetical protein
VRFIHGQNKKVTVQIQPGSVMLTRKAFIYNNMLAAGTLFAGSSLLSELIC